MSEPVLRRPPRPVIPNEQPHRPRNYRGEDGGAHVKPTTCPAPYDWAVDIPEWGSVKRNPDGSRARIPALVDLPDLLAAHPVSLGAVPGPGGARLTRRGRVVLVVALTVAATSVLSLLFLTTARAGDLPPSSPASSAVGGGAGGLNLPPEGTIIVKDGDTLWEIAEEVRPAEDPRRTVHEIVEVNGLDGSDVDPGQEIVVPGS